MIRRFGAFMLACALIVSQTVAPAFALSTDGRADTWTPEKAAHLANRVYYAATADEIDRLFAAGSARAAVDLVFPDASGPDRASFSGELATLVATEGFAYDNSGWMRVYYQIRFGRDPYEAKAKLFSLFEDIFSLNEGSAAIDYPDVIRHSELVYSHTLGNYRTMVKRVLYNDGAPGDYAMGTFLNLLNGADADNPNENYARELMQLFLMGEYLPGDSKEAGSVRNYSEDDVEALARILTGFRSDASHAVFYDSAKHSRATGLAFLTGALAAGTSFPFYDEASGTLDVGAMEQSVIGNDGLADNAIDYIFAKRQHAIAMFLANRLYRFYVEENPERADLDRIADSILAHDFEILPVVKELLASDAMYSDRAMNEVRYKNPLEMIFGTAKLLHGGRPEAADPLLRRSDALSSLGWNAYNANSIFGRDGFDANFKFMTAYTYNQWLTYATRIANTAGTGTYSLDELFRGRTVAVAGSAFVSGTGVAYTGAVTLGTGSVSFVPVAAPEPAMLRRASLESSTEDVATGTGEADISLEESSGADTGSGADASEGAETSILPESATGFTASGETAPQESGTGSVDEAVGAMSGTSAPEEVPLSDSGAMATPVEESLSGASLPVSEPAASVLPEDLPVADMPTTEADPSVPATEPASMDAPAASESDPADMPIVTEMPADPAPAPAEPVSEPISALFDWLVPVASAQSTPDTAVLTGARLRVSDMVILSSGSGTLRIFSGSISPSSDAILVYSGSYTASGVAARPVYDASFPVLSGSLSREKNAPELVDSLAPALLPYRTLPENVRASFIAYLSTDNSGATMLPHPAVNAYATARLRGLVAFMLSQPEYVMVSGYDRAPVSSEATGASPLSAARGKLVIVQMYGGYDWLHGVIPKADYELFAQGRTTATNGTIATDLSRLIDLGDYYMSNDFSAYAPYALSGNLKVFNGVGGSWHSSDHDAAQRQMASWADTTDFFADGIVGRLAMNERDSSKVVALDAGSPGVYRSGNHISIGENGAQIRNTDGSVSAGDRARYVAALRDLVASRAYPGESSGVFREAVKINDVSVASKARGGRDGSGPRLADRLAFAKDLMDGGVGQIYYLNAEDRNGGFDTHKDQVRRPGTAEEDLDDRLANLSGKVADFFASVKDRHDVTVIVFSEFGRTIRMNSDRGTDHGQGGGMFMLTNNAAIRAALPAVTYGSTSLARAQGNWIGVGIDYRSVYGVVYQALYGIDTTTFFNKPVSLARDLSMAPARIGRLETRYQPLSQSRVRVSVSAEVAGENLSFDRAGYVRFGTATNTGVSSLMSADDTRQNFMSGSVLSFNRDVNSGQSVGYRIEATTNQYVRTVLSGSVATPRIVTAPQAGPVPGGSGAVVGPSIRPDSDSILYAYRNTPVDGEVTLTASGITLWDTGTGSSEHAFSGRGGVEWRTSSGRTAVTSLFGTGVVWQGGFILGEGYSAADFFGTGSLVASGVSIPVSAIARVAKIGSDVPGVGMRLSQDVLVTMSGAAPSASYRVYRSEDGRAWENIASGARISADAMGRVTFATDRFSYFALVSAVPVCQIAFDVPSAPVGQTVNLSYAVSNASSAQIAPYVGAVSPLAASGTVPLVVSAGTTEYVMTLDGNPAYSCRASIAGTGGPGAPAPENPAPETPAPETPAPSDPSSASASSNVSPSLLGGSGGLPPSHPAYMQRTRAEAAEKTKRSASATMTGSTAESPEAAEPADDAAAGIRFSEERIEKTRAAILKSLRLSDLDAATLARVRLRQDLVDRVERSIVRAVASGESAARANRLVQMLVAFDRIIADLPASSNLSRTVRALRASVVAKFPEEADSAGSLAASLADLPSDSAPAPVSGVETLTPAVVPAESRRAARTMRR